MDKTTLVLGASSKPERFSFDAIRSLQKNNIPVIAVGRREADLGDIRIMKGMPHDIGPVHTVTLYLSAINQKAFYSYILSLKPKRIIFNPGTTNPELAALAALKGITVVNECMLVMLNKGIF
ncbi:MAG: CoA-binding protein [Bacteroidales bacterium]|nr:CoA-binding protein [Bacteroidales bacterium]